MKGLQKYIDWVNEGHRSIEIKMETLSTKETEIKVWCYSYTLSSGEHIELGEDPPTDAYLKEARITRLEAELCSI